MTKRPAIRVRGSMRATVAWVALSVIGGGVSVYLAHADRYFYLGRVPGAVLAVWFYVGTLVLALCRHFWTRPSSQRSIAVLLLVGSSAAFMISIAAFRSIAVCVVNATMFGLALSSLRTPGEPTLDVIRKHLVYFGRHPEWILIPVFAGAFAVLLTVAAYPRRAVGDRCGELGAAVGERQAGVVKLVAYHDFQCGPCRNANATLRRWRGHPRLNVVSRHFPLDRECNPSLPRSFHPGACLQARAALCGGQDYSDRLFESSAIAEADLIAIASSLQLDVERFRECVHSAETSQTLKTEIAVARVDGVDATPTFIVQGHRWVGLFDPAELACLLEEKK